MEPKVANIDGFQSMTGEKIDIYKLKYFQKNSTGGGTELLLRFSGVCCRVVWYIVFSLTLATIC
jgi:hypothetical protein